MGFHEKGVAFEEALLVQNSLKIAQLSFIGSILLIS